MAFTPTRIPSVPARLRTALLALTALVPLAGLLAPPAVAAGRTPTHEDIWLLKRVGAPVASPDGRWAVISVTDPAYDDTQASDLWLVPTDGSAAPRRLTATRAGESGAAWSPDSRQLAFSAQREGDDAPQIYLLDIARGGEAQRVTSLVIGARAPQFSPDGKQLLFVANPYPGAITDAENRKAMEAEKARKYKARVYTGFPIRNWDRWLDERRPHLFVQPVDGSGPARNLLAGTELAKSPGFAAGEELEATWTPDGQ
ncbi:MAG: TolB family protein [Gammaproteobacteria bacterium]